MYVIHFLVPILWDSMALCAGAVAAEIWGGVIYNQLKSSKLEFIARYRILPRLSQFYSVRVGTPTRLR